MNPQLLAALIGGGYYNGGMAAQQQAGAANNASLYGYLGDLAGARYGYEGQRDNALANYYSALAGAQSNLGVGRYGYLGDLAQAKYGYLANKDTAISNAYQSYYPSVAAQTDSMTNLYSNTLNPLNAYMSNYATADADRYTTALQEAGKNQRLGALGQMLSGFMGQYGNNRPAGGAGGFTTNYGGSIQ